MDIIPINNNEVIANIRFDYTNIFISISIITGVIIVGYVIISTIKSIKQLCFDKYIQDGHHCYYCCPNKVYNST